MKSQPSCKKLQNFLQTPSENGVTEIVDVQKTVNDGRWGPLQTSDDVKMMRQSGVPVKTRNQAKWALGVWSDWASYRRTNIDLLFLRCILCYFCSFHAYVL